MTRRSLLRRMATFTASVAGVLAAPLTFAKGTINHLSKVGGQIIRRADANYELWRSSMVWYLHKPDRYPDLIVRAENERDVVAAINHARENAMKVSVRSTGHNPARGVLRDGGVLLDLAQLRDVDIDAAAGTAWIQPGIRSEELIALTEREGLAFPAAHTGIVGLGGYLLGGGLGWNMPEWDLACRSILAAEIITADGRKIVANQDEYGDLLWAVRGAGPGFFGAVIRYKLQLYPLPTAITKSKYLVPIERLPVVVGELAKIRDAKDKRLEILAVVGRWAPIDAPPSKRQLQCAVSAVAFANSPDDAAALLSPVAASRIPALSELKRENVAMKYADLYQGQETDHASPNRTVAENIWTDDPGECLLAIADRYRRHPPASPRSFGLSAWGINPAQDDPSSCLLSPARDYFSWYVMAEDPSHVEPNGKWMDESVKEMRPFTKGHYVNEIDPIRYPQHVPECFSAESWKRLAGLRAKYDPENVFYTYLGRV